MNPVKKILVAHGDPKLKRRLVLMLADAGFDVRAQTEVATVLTIARVEWFDLALVGPTASGTNGLEVVEQLRGVQPTVPVLLLAAEPELALLVQGIRIGLADVLPLGDDFGPVLRRIHELLFPDTTAPTDETRISATELAEVESALTRIDDVNGQPTVATPQTGHDIREELLRSTRERADLEAKLQRFLHEKNALEAELQMLVSQNTDAELQQQELADLRTQRERVASAQAAIDAKTSLLAEQREKIARERDVLEQERQRLTTYQPLLPDWAASAEEVATMLDRARVEESRNREKALQLQQEAAQIARERRRWHDDLDLLREQETNLKEYESRLRKVQAQLEADRVLWFSTTARPTASKSPFDDSTLRDAWQKLQRASELLETERAHARDDRLYCLEQEKTLKARIQTLTAREARAAELEARYAMMAAPPPVEADPAIPPPSPMRVLVRAPLDLAKSVFGVSKKSNQPRQAPST